MRRLSLTFCCPMNSLSRCGRSESSTTDSSASTSGVVISARDIATHYRVFEKSQRVRRPRKLTEYTPKPQPFPSHARSQPLKLAHRRFERLALLAEGESDIRTAELRTAEEARAGNGRDADVSSQPPGELDVRPVTHRREVGKDVVGAFRHRELESGIGERAGEKVAALVVGQHEVVVVVRVEGEPHRGGGLQRCRCADGEEVVHLPDRVALRRGRYRPADPPPRAAPRLREARDRYRPLPHVGPGRDLVVV